MMEKNKIETYFDKNMMHLI